MEESVTDDHIDLHSWDFITLSGRWQGVDSGYGLEKVASQGTLWNTYRRRKNKAIPVATRSVALLVFLAPI